MVERGKPQLYGGCFGSQLLAVALGGKVAQNPSKHFCFQSEELKINPNWNKHPVLINFSSTHKHSEKGTYTFGENELRLLESHGECVGELPPGATLAASSKTITNEVWYIGHHVLAVQSHPEFSPKLMTDRILPSLMGKGMLSDNEALHAHASFDKPLDSERMCDLIRQFLCYQHADA